jgi:hypothetical protein
MRGRLHVSESAYDSPYDSVKNLYANLIWIQFYIYTFQKKNKQKKNLLDTFGSKSYTESYGDSYGKSHV